MAQRTEVRNAADPQQVKGADKRTKRRQVARLDFYRAVMLTQPGRAVMWDLLARAGIYETSYDNLAMAMARNEGRRMLGLELLADLVELDKDLYLLMETEARARDARDAQETEAAHVAPATQQENAQ